MIDFTPLVRPWFMQRVKASREWTADGGIERAQRRQLAMLLHDGARCRQGEELDFKTLSSCRDTVEAFRHTVPVSRYEDVRDRVMRMVGGEPDVLWPGRCLRFAQSSGTSGDKSKYIPVTTASLRLNHYLGGRDTVAHYLAMRPDSRLFSGKGFILGGSFANELADLPRGVRVGDLSANLIEAINPLANLMRVPDKATALMAHWDEKLPALVAAASRKNVTNISGVPSWFMTVLRKILEHTGATNIHDVWPGLEVFFHGGISFEPYRSQYAALTDPRRMHYLETYNASEGFFAVQDSKDNNAGMLLLLDAGIFFEFVPLAVAEREDMAEAAAAALPAWAVEAGQIYALVISSCNGLMRYWLGDTVEIVSTSPRLRIRIAGRTRCFINAFGEELMVHNADAALARACEATGASVENYTAAPIYADGGHHGCHQWLIEWSTPPSCGKEAFADILDTELQHENSDYQAKRADSIFLDRLCITDATPGQFDRWLAATGKLGGQRKVPRLYNDRRIIEAVMKEE